MFWEPFGSLLDGSLAAWGSPRVSPGSPLGSLGNRLGFSWVAFASPGGSLGGSRGLQEVSWAAVGALLGRPSGEAVKKKKKNGYPELNGSKESAFPVSKYAEVCADGCSARQVRYFRGVGRKLGLTCLGGSPKVFWEPFGRLLGGSWGALGSPRGCPGGPLGCLGGILACPGSVLGDL